jgi:hypothetical protein
MFACCFSTAVFNGAVKATRDNGVRARIYTTRVQLLRQRWNEAIAAGSSHARDGTGILIRLHTSATTFTTSLNILKLCILPTQCIQVRHVILTFRSYESWNLPVYVIKAYEELEVALHSFLTLTLEVGEKFTFHSQLNRSLCVPQSRSGRLRRGNSLAPSGNRKIPRFSSLSLVTTMTDLSRLSCNIYLNPKQLYMIGICNGSIFTVEQENNF